LQEPTSKSPRGAEPNVALPAVPPALSGISSFPIIGIGASAGGLEALEIFLAHMPPDSGMAFVIVQHLDPTHQGLLAELLQRNIAMRVKQIEDGMEVKRDCVYVIPPNRDLSIFHGVLHLLEPTAPRGLRLPIDSFFRSLALDQRERSIGVILSGMGSDGTLGLRAIKENGGAILVQTPESARFDGMPRSAIDSGLVDAVAPAEKLPEEIARCVGGLRPNAPVPEEEHGDKEKSGLDKVILILRTAKGHDFSHYKKSTVYRRVERRMSLHQIAKITDYVRYLRENSQEAELLFKELLIGVTSFFRDPAVWEELKAKVIPELMAAHPDGGVMRAWSAGCSTGEEAYSLAIAFSEVLDELKPHSQYSLQIFATDLDRDAIDKARSGQYPVNIAADVSEERLRRFFVHGETGFQVSKEIREMVIFAEQNLIADPPFTRLDLLLCRNLMIYLDAELQNSLIPLFHYSLVPGGVLVLGTSESVGSGSDLLRARAGSSRLYQRKGTVLTSNAADFPAMLSKPAHRVISTFQSVGAPQFTANLQSQADGLLLKSYAPAAVLTTRSGDIVYISGKTGKYLEPAAGKANLNIFAMAREGLNGVLNVAFGQALRKCCAVVTKGVKVGTNGGTQYVDLIVHPLTEPAGLQGMVMVVFTEISAPGAVGVTGKFKSGSAAAARIAALEAKLQQAEEGLQIAREEMQTSQEELQSANEELQSTNEELQSTNEELTTSKEEMQSMNEELQTVNQELTGKMDGLSRSNDDMHNLLNSIDIATLFLDTELKVRRFTPQTLDIVQLIPTDIGRPITDLVNRLDYPELVNDAHEVLRTLVYRERQVFANNGRCFRVRIVPYRTQNNRIDGLVVTFIDITALKGLESTMREALSVLESRFETQASALDDARAKEAVLRSAQTVLEEKLAENGAKASKNTGNSKTMGGGTK